MDLLKHPLVTSLLRDKWQTYGFIIYFANLFIYLIFLAFLTTFALSVPNPQACELPLAQSLDTCVCELYTVGFDCIKNVVFPGFYCNTIHIVYS